MRKIKAQYQGKDGMDGYSTRKHYDLFLSKGEPGSGAIIISRGNHEGEVTYKDILSFLDHWTDIKVAQITQPYPLYVEK